MIEEPNLKMDEFSLVRGGPFYWAMLRARLMRPGRAGIVRTASFFAVFTWLPMLILSALQAVAFGGNVKVPFLMDFTVIGLAVCAALPMAPLVLTVIPFSEIIKRILELLI